MTTTTVLVLLAIVLLVLKSAGIVYLYRRYFGAGESSVFVQSRGRYCYGKQETARRKRQIDRLYLTVANGLVR